MPDRTITRIIIHCSATPDGVALARAGQTAAQVIDAWHGARKFNRLVTWRSSHRPQLQHIGYHYVIDTDGTVEPGRDPNEIGAHVAGHNVYSLGICMVGTSHYPVLAWQSLQTLVQILQREHRYPLIQGHRDLSSDLDGDGTVEPHEWLKTCPGFSVSDWINGGLMPLPAHVCPKE